MSRSFRFVLAGVLAAAAAGLGACGGDDRSAAELLKDTFGEGHEVSSGDLSIALTLDAQGLQQVQGPISLKLAGPFQSRGQDKLPAFDLSLALNAGGGGFNGGAVSTGEKGFLRVQGQTFEVSDQLFAQFRDGYEKAASTDDEKSGDGPTFASLGIDPLRWLENPEKQGTEQVGGAETHHITAGVDVTKFLADLNELLSKAGALGQQANLPKGLTEQQRQDIAQAVQSATLEVWTGTEDTTLRRLVLDLRLEVPEEVRPRAGGLSTGDLTFDLTISELNEDQEIKEPEDARPLTDLTSVLGAAQGAPQQGAPQQGAPPDGAPPAGEIPGAGSDPATSAYLTCLQEAAGDVAKIQQCAELAGQ